MQDFTGVPAMVDLGAMRAAIAAHGGQFLRWNVHPPLRDQVAMIDRLGARHFAPLFCDRPEDYLLESQFRARLLLNERMSL